MSYLIGLDVGSVNVKLALVADEGSVMWLGMEKVTSSPGAALSALLKRLSRRVDLSRIAAAGISGASKGLVPRELNWSEYTSPLAIAYGLLQRHPDVSTIIQVGGQTALVIELEDGLNRPWRVAANPLCAAGTGRFLEQQAYRLGISMEEFARLALACEGTPPRIAARCSVFAKTDLIHLQQKGAPVEAMLYALCESVARMVVSLKKGAFREPIYFVGGVAANAAIVKALNELISQRNGYQVNIKVPQDHLFMEAIGAALLSRGKSSRVMLLEPATAEQRYFKLPPLPPVASRELADDPIITVPCAGYLGVDVGSTSTKAVILDETGKRVLAKHYLMTAGRPVEAVKEVFRNLLKKGADKVTVLGAGVTGSGRYLIGSLIGADLIKNEITAQARAAAEIDPEADIIEIGGQDSKLVLKRHGTVVDYHMNKACAAGTGSFIDELAEMLGVSVKDGEFARLAFAAPHTIDLGTRCAAFMGQAVASVQQDNVPLEVITASLANSIARNYLSKVVGTKKLGKKVILTGAVFYNQAVVAAFREQLKDKQLIVAEHKEVSGAIGAAILAKEQMTMGKSRFKGFREVIDSQYNFSTFVCKGCDNNCTITRMQLPGEKPTFYGSRCDRYDSTISRERIQTYFDEREKLLLKEYREGEGRGPTVGIPRALYVHDYLPLLLGFLNALGVRVVLSPKTNKEIIERSVELSYTDSCFPLKLVYGHMDSLKDKVDFILYPCAIRLGEKEGAENQKYACPLVQAAPFIVREALDLGERLLIPFIDFSHGYDNTIESLADVAARMGFNRGLGRRAAAAGIEAQRQFETGKAALGKKLLDELHQSGKLGVVILARSYMSQDSGANLGIAETLAHLGVAPIPLDFLPLDSVDVKKYSDRPYWAWESKQIAAAAIVEADPQLFGLVVTNFGCGPNSFILRLVEDIMGEKPLGQLEIDEHAAEAGIVTRLEAFVDTITGYAKATRERRRPRPEDIYRGTLPLVRTQQKTLVVHRMCHQVEAIAAAMEACGARVLVLPEPDDRNLLLANQITSGTECLPYRVTLGDLLKFCFDNHHRLDEYEGFTAGSYGPCRFGKYAIEHMRALKDLGFEFPIHTTVSNNAYRDINLGADFERLAWQGIVAIDQLEKLLWRTRPYEKQPGGADNLFEEYKGRIVARIRKKEPFDDVLKEATAAFKELVDTSLPRRPLVGINGEIYLRSNRFSNNDLVRACEAAGLEVVVSPIGEWLKYIYHRHFEDAVMDRKWGKAIVSYIKKRIQERDEHRLARHCRGVLDIVEPAVTEILGFTGRYLSPKCGSEAVLSIGSGVEWLENPKFAGVISVMPHGCMPGGIVAAMAEKLSSIYHKPWISLTYDGFPETNNLAKINSFAELIKFCARKGAEPVGTYPRS